MKVGDIITIRGEGEALWVVVEVNEQATAISATRIRDDIASGWELAEKCSVLPPAKAVRQLRRMLEEHEAAAARIHGLLAATGSPPAAARQG